jgi:hypothetical protein
MKRRTLCCEAFCETLRTPNYLDGPRAMEEYFLTSSAEAEVSAPKVRLPAVSYGVFGKGE